MCYVDRMQYEWNPATMLIFNCHFNHSWSFIVLFAFLKHTRDWTPIAKSLIWSQFDLYWFCDFLITTNTFFYFFFTFVLFQTIIPTKWNAMKKSKKKHSKKNSLHLYCKDWQKTNHYRWIFVNYFLNIFNKQNHQTINYQWNDDVFILLAFFM